MVILAGVAGGSGLNVGDKVEDKVQGKLRVKGPIPESAVGWEGRDCAANEVDFSPFILLVRFRDLLLI